LLVLGVAPDIPLLRLVGANITQTLVLVFAIQSDDANTILVNLTMEVKLNVAACTYVLVSVYFLSSFH
jgi:hypothetical protein